MKKIVHIQALFESGDYLSLSTKTNRTNNLPGENLIVLAYHERLEGFDKCVSGDEKNMAGGKEACHFKIWEEMYLPADKLSEAMQAFSERVIDEATTTEYRVENISNIAFTTSLITDKPKPTLSAKEQAEQAFMFRDSDHGFLRMRWCGENHFGCFDEATGELYSIEYAYVDLTTCSFYKLEKI